MLALVFIKILHTFISLFTVGGVYFTNDPRILALIVWLLMCMVLQWYLCGDCIFTPIEHALEGRKLVYHNGKNMSFLSSTLLVYFSEKQAFYIVTLLPLVTTTIALYKMVIVCNGLSDKFSSW